LKKKVKKNDPTADLTVSKSGTVKSEPRHFIGVAGFGALYKFTGKSIKNPPGLKMAVKRCLAGLELNMEIILLQIYKIIICPTSLFKKKGA
jgi:hypothetical protein